MAENKVYVIVSNMRNDAGGADEYVQVEGVFADKDKADERFSEVKKRIEEEFLLYYDKEDMDAEDTDAYFSLWKKWDYDEYHYELRMFEETLR